MLWFHCSVKKIYSFYHRNWLDRFERIILADKKGKNRKNARRWTELAEVPADPANNLFREIGTKKISMTWTKIVAVDWLLQETIGAAVPRVWLFAICILQNMLACFWHMGCGVSGCIEHYIGKAWIIRNCQKALDEKSLVNSVGRIEVFFSFIFRNFFW